MRASIAARTRAWCMPAMMACASSCACGPPQLSCTFRAGSSVGLPPHADKHTIMSAVTGRISERCSASVGADTTRTFRGDTRGGRVVGGRRSLQYLDPAPQRSAQVRSVPSLLCLIVAHRLDLGALFRPCTC